MMCMDCYEVYDSKYLSKDYRTLPCPKRNCDGSTVEIDELMLIPVKILNQKGYITEFCCSGHVHESVINTYIKFYEDIKLPNLPKGFEDDMNLYPRNYGYVTNCIRRRYAGQTDSEIQLQILEGIKDLVDWVNELEVLEY